jgi:predicted GH43/DUF377 family glycosyl hydrolase
MGEYYYITYASRFFPFGQFWMPKEQQYVRPVCPAEFPRVIRNNATSTGLLLTKDFKSFIRAGRITDPVLDDRDVILFPEKIDGRYYLMHRPLEWVGSEYGTEHAAAWISSAEDLLGFRKSKLLIKQKYAWEAGKLGVNTSERCCWTWKTRERSCIARPTGLCSPNRITKSMDTIEAAFSPAARS